MTSFRRIAATVATAVLALTGLAAPAQAVTAAQAVSFPVRTAVSGTFRTPNPPTSQCPGVDPSVDCQVDLLYGDIGGTTGAFDQLTTHSYNDSQRFWPYVDYTKTKLQYGKFPANNPVVVFGDAAPLGEHGLVDSQAGPTQGDFVSYRTALSRNGCWKLNLVFTGHIDLSGVLDPNGNPVDPDQGNYTGTVTQYC